MSSLPDLSAFDNSDYSPGRPFFIVALWFFFGLPVLRSSILPFSGLRCQLLRLFGSKVGKGVVIKPGVRVKYPWLLQVGNHSWIGEDVWIDNLVLVTVGSNSCLSQGAYLCTGNHDWTDGKFRLIAKPISLMDGSWVGAKSIVCPGVTVGEGAIAAAGSTVSADIPAFEIHAGNPARLVRLRKLSAG